MLCVFYISHLVHISKLTGILPWVGLRPPAAALMDS